MPLSGVSPKGHKYLTPQDPPDLPANTKDWALVLDGFLTRLQAAEDAVSKGASGVNIQVFKVGDNLTWSKPPGVKSVHVRVVHAGQGGQAGPSPTQDQYANNAHGSTTFAGGSVGGNPGGVVERVLQAAELPDQVAITVGVGGTGGVGVPNQAYSLGSSGAAGAAGGLSSFGVFVGGAGVSPAGVSPGVGGRSATLTQANPQVVQVAATAGAAPGGDDTASVAAPAPILDRRTTSGTATSGVAGTDGNPGSTTTPGAGLGSGGAPGQNGQTSNDTSGTVSKAGNGGKGGKGGFPGGGGGAGGAAGAQSYNGGSGTGNAGNWGKPGDGGAGADGVVVVTSFLSGS